jgi:hypothetical protein
MRDPEFDDRVMYNKKGTARLPFLFCSLAGCYLNDTSSIRKVVDSE